MGPNEARVQTIDPDTAVRPQTFCQFAGKQDECQFALAVSLHWSVLSALQIDVIEMNFASDVQNRRYIDYTRMQRLLQFPQQK